jgi:hypothetical protein
MFLYAQNYACLQPGVTAYFTDGIVQNPLRADSVVQHTGHQVWWNFPVIRPADGFYCHTQNGGMWMGRKTRIYPDGRYVFYNRDGLPVEILSQAGLNDTWKCCDLAAGRLDATITGMAQETFLGLTDMVKTITLQAKDAQGNNMTHPLNGKLFKISQNYGFTQVVGIYLFPDLTDEIPDEIKEYTLSGLSSPATGYQNLTFDDFFNLAPGDELHIYQKYEYWMNSGEETRAIKVLTDKSYSAGGTELALTWQVCSRHRQYSGLYDTLIFYDGPQTETINISEYQTNLDPLPGEVIAPEDYPSFLYYNQAYNNAFGRPYKQMFWGFHQVPDDTCLGIIITKKGPETTLMGYPADYYVDGLGGPYYTYWDFSYSTRVLVYWKKGNNEWGIPYTCSEILGTPGQQPVGSIKIYPNPVTEKMVKIEGTAAEPMEMTLLDPAGRYLLREISSEGNAILNLTSLRQGVYFLKVSQGSNILTTKLIIQ